MSDWWDKFLIVAMAILIVIFISLAALVVMLGWTLFFAMVGGGQ